MKIGDKVRLVYDARPMMLTINTGEGEIIRITPSGLVRIKGHTSDLVRGRTERNELFDPITGYAKGWNTLRFEILEENPDEPDPKLVSYFPTDDPKEVKKFKRAAGIK